GLLGLVALRFERRLLVLRVVEHLLQLGALGREDLVQLGQAALGGLDAGLAALDRAVDLLDAAVGVGDALALGLDLLRQGVVLAVVAHLELLLLVALDELLGLLDVELRLAAADLVLLLLLVVL